MSVIYAFRTGNDTGSWICESVPDTGWAKALRHPIEHLAKQIAGVREAVVLAELLKVGSDDIEGWAADLYDPSLRTEPLRNISEDEKYDAKFPDHPFSRVRRQIRHLLSTLIVAPEVKAAAPF